MTSPGILALTLVKLGAGELLSKAKVEEGRAVVTLPELSRPRLGIDARHSFG